MKKLAFALALCLALLMLAGCGGAAGTRAAGEPAPSAATKPDIVTPEVSRSQSEPSFSSSSSVASSSSASSTPPSSSSAEETYDVFGYYLCELEDVSDEYQPSIEVFRDGTFIMKVNLYEGMGTIEGVFIQDEDLLYMTVTSRDFSGFVGDDVDSFVFWYWRWNDYEDLNYWGDTIGMTQEDDVFIKVESY